MNRRRAVAKAMGKKMKKEETEELDEKKGLYAIIHAKRKVVKHLQNQATKTIPPRTLSRKQQRLLRKKR